MTVKHAKRKNKESGEWNPMKIYEGIGNKSLLEKFLNLGDFNFVLKCNLVHRFSQLLLKFGGGLISSSKIKNSKFKVARSD